VKAKKELVKEVAEKKTSRVRSGAVKAIGFIGTLKAWVAVNKKRKAFAIVVGVLILLGILTAIPFTRYAVYGVVIKKEVQFVILDTVSKAPVSGVNVKLGSVSGMTDSTGKVTLHNIAVGNYRAVVSKKFYKDTTVTYTVPLFFTPTVQTESLAPTGRPVTITVTNSVTGDALANVTASVDDSSSITDKNGEVILVVSPKVQKQTITIKGNDYNDESLAIDLGKTTSYKTTLTPQGSIFYLSNATGVINVMRANLDGSSPEVAVKGTGNENSSTLLLSSRDWSYSAYLATRTSNPSVYIIDTQGNYVEIDNGDTNFSFVGWSGHTFFYEVTRNTAHYWDANRTSIKAYNADTKKLTTIDQNSGTGSNDYVYAYDYFSTINIIDGKIFYLKIPEVPSYRWDGSQKVKAIVVDAKSYDSKVLKEYPLNNPYGNADVRFYEPGGIYIQITSGGTVSYYEYEDGAIKSINITGEKYSSAYPTYLISPSGDKTFWYEKRDGKNTLFIGDNDGKNQKQIASLSDYTPYGWYGDNDQYVLLTKNGSELYIATPDTINNPQKVTDYYRSQIINGYGAGYGGQ
jgi:hypothetical protein